MVQVARLELAASCSQSRRATNCATPGYPLDLVYYTRPGAKKQSQNERTMNSNLSSRSKLRNLVILSVVRPAANL